MSGPFGRQFSLKITIVGEKRAPKNYSKKVPPHWQTTHAGRLPEAALACAFSRTETTVRTTTAATTPTLAETTAHFEQQQQH